MKNFATAIVVCFFVGPVSFGKSISAQKIKELPRSTTIVSGMIPAPKGESDWRDVDQILGENAKYENKDQNFKIASGKEEADAGDLARSRFFLTKGAGKKEPLASEPLAYVYILSGGEFLLLEPLILIDTRTWQRTDLAAAAKISPYFSVLRYSPKGRKLLVAQFDCAADCSKSEKTTVWQIAF